MKIKVDGLFIIIFTARFRANVKNFRLNRGFGFNSYLCILFLYIVVFMHHVKFSNGIVRKGIQGMDFMK